MHIDCAGDEWRWFKWTSPFGVPQQWPVGAKQRAMCGNKKPATASEKADDGRLIAWGGGWAFYRRFASTTIIKGGRKRKTLTLANNDSATSSSINKLCGTVYVEIDLGEKRDDERR